MAEQLQILRRKMVTLYRGSAATRSCEFQRSPRTFCDGFESGRRGGSASDALRKVPERHQEFPQVVKKMSILFLQGPRNELLMRPELTIISVTVTYFVRRICSLTSSSRRRIRYVVEMAELWDKPFQQTLQIGTNGSLFLFESLVI